MPAKAGKPGCLSRRLDELLHSLWPRTLRTDGTLPALLLRVFASVTMPTHYSRFGAASWFICEFIRGEEKKNNNKHMY